LLQIPIEDTKIADKQGQPLTDITVDAGEPIELQARMYWYFYAAHSKPTWIPQICRKLNFYLYTEKGDLVWSDSAITNFFTANANPDEFTLNERGSYKLVVRYNGTLKHCVTTADINVR
jgi:hypothetical protein